MKDSTSIVGVLILVVAILVALQQWGVPAFTDRIQSRLVTAAKTQ